MSRIGKQPVGIPDGVEVQIDKRTVTAKGPKGELSLTLPRGVRIAETDEGIVVSPTSHTKRLRARWGTARALLANMVHGVHEGHEKKLELQGVGYRAQMQGDTLVLSVGYSHPVEIPAPEGISLSVEKNIITVSGTDKDLVGRTADRIRAVRKPEPYKGKGIRYQGENIRRKAGKKAVTAAGA